MWLVSAALAAAPVEIVQPEAPAPEPFSALGLYQARFTRSSVVTTNPYLDGQVIGALGGTNGTEVSAEDRSTWAEQRAVAFLTWAPLAASGRAELTAAFEVDFVFGDQSYAVGGNTGGAFGADQVNLQTRRLHAAFTPAIGHELDIVTGLQFVGDSAYDPRSTPVDTLATAGAGLSLWGSEAAGITAYGRVHDGWGTRLRYRAGAYTLYEQGIGLSDDVTLYVGDLQAHVGERGLLAGHAWYLRDAGDGTAGLLGSGLSSALSELQGARRLDLRASEDDEAPALGADVVWLGLDGGVDPSLQTGRLGARAAFFVNTGRLWIEDQPDAGILGSLGLVDARWAYAEGDGSRLSLAGVYSSGDGAAPDYNGVVTGNSYGIAGAMWSSHGALLLFPDPGAVNRQVALAYDVSGFGRGLTGVSAQLGYDLVPNELTLGGTVAYAYVGDMDPLGTELNAKLRYRPLPLLDLSLAAAAVTGSDFDAPPFTLLVAADWILF